jgi:hypothetical protein
MVENDVADPNDQNTLAVPFIFVSHGSAPPAEWLNAHPGWIRIPATLIPRDPADGESGTHWSVRIHLLGEPASFDTQVAGNPAATTARAGLAGMPVYQVDTTVSAAAWPDVQAHFLAPMSTVGIFPVAHTRPAPGDDRERDPCGLQRNSNIKLVASSSPEMSSHEDDPLRL